MKKILFCVMFILVAGCFLRAEKVTVHDGQVTVERDDGSTVLYKSIRFAEEDGVVIPQDQRESTETPWHENIKRTNSDDDTMSCVQPLTQKAYEDLIWGYWEPREADEIVSMASEMLKKTASRSERNAGFLLNRFSYIPAGTFVMGNSDGEGERCVEVIISNCFLLGKTEVTQKQWKSIMKHNPSNYQGDNSSYKDDDLPVEGVSWAEAMEFCQILTQKERGAGRLPKNWKYTLPTEAQWEYACRAGTTTRFNFGDSEDDLARFAWYRNSGWGETHPVAQKLPNAWGLYDMHGNVLEWCLDYYDRSLIGGVDPIQTDGELRVYRGGSWDSWAYLCGSADRNVDTFYGGVHGFRIALVQE